MVDDAERAGGGDGAADRPAGESTTSASPPVGGSGGTPGASALSNSAPAGVHARTGVAAQAEVAARLAAGERWVVGAMSGTSADGVDAALVAVAGRGDRMSCRLVAHRHVPYDPWVRQAVFGMRAAGHTDLRSLARVARDASLCYAKAVADVLAAAGVSPADVAAVAAHGQTLFHDPPCTIQWLDPSLLAAETGIAVVSDFRRADCAAGGQGAPLVPFADHVLFRHPTKTRVLLNIGGIANLTHLPAGGPIDQLVAFDTGPGNCVSDHLMRVYDPAGPGYDAGGALADLGRPVFPLIRPMLEDPYFAAPTPKSTDGPAMIDVYARAYAALGRKFPFENLLKTACLLTATTIADAIRRLDPFPDELIVSGGGTRNAAIMGLLRQPLGDLPVLTSDELGMPAEAKEAVAFALLGAATLDGEPGNVPAATGAKRRVVLGSVTPRP
jgi:anhydro-N-acetylmuramic acid kinase